MTGYHHHHRQRLLICPLFCTVSKNFLSSLWMSVQIWKGQIDPGYPYAAKDYWGRLKTPNMRPLKTSYSGLEPNTFKSGAQFYACHFMCPNIFFLLYPNTRKSIYFKTKEPRIWTEKCQKINVNLPEDVSSCVIDELIKLSKNLGQGRKVKGSAKQKNKKKTVAAALATPA